MKKIIVIAAIAALAFSSVAKAELQISANVTTMAFYQMDGANGANAASGAGGVTQGDLGNATASSATHYGFAVNQAEVDLENEFGENIMARIDLDFIDLGTPSASAFLLEQAYVTLNIGIGNGMEFMVGKFNAPLGLENFDRHENVFSTYTPGYLFLTPTQVMGLKFYYEFNDHWNFDLAIVDSMNAVNAINSHYPSGIFRVGAKWGDEGHGSYVNLGVGYGPEHSTAVTGTASNAKADLYGTLWGNFALGEYWDLGWEGIYRQTSGFGGTQKAFAGQMYAVVKASDVWTIQFRGAAHKEQAAAGSGASTTGGFWNDGTGTGAGGFQGMGLSGTLGGTYQITDGAQMKLEYRFDMAMVTAAADPMFHTLVTEFAYSF